MCYPSWEWTWTCRLWRWFACDAIWKALCAFIGLFLTILYRIKNTHRLSSLLIPNPLNFSIQWESMRQLFGLRAPWKLTPELCRNSKPCNESSSFSTNSLPFCQDCAKTKSNKPWAYPSRMLLEYCSSSSLLQLVSALTEICMISIYYVESFEIHTNYTFHTASVSLL